jgi:hypothetical protein
VKLNVDGSYVQEVYIPWSSIPDLYDNIYSPGNNLSFGFDVCIVDNDGVDNGNARYRKVWSNIGRINENWFNMNDAGLLQCNIGTLTDSLIFNTIESKTYGNSSFYLNATTSTGLSILYSSSNTNVAQISGNIVSIVGSGTSNITAYLSDSSKSITRILTVNKAPLTAYTGYYQKEQGTPNPTFTINYSGFVNGDNEYDLDVLPEAYTYATTSSPAGYYNIYVSGGNDNNYNISYSYGTLEIVALTYPDSIAIISYATNPITIDGIIDVTEWGNATQHHIENIFVGEEDGFSGPEDLTAYWKAAYTNTGIYVLVNVIADDVHNVDLDGIDWQQDLAEVYFDMNTNNLKDGSGPYGGQGQTPITNNGHYSLTRPAMDDSTYLDDWAIGRGIQRMIQVASDNSYIEEIYFPWSAIPSANGIVFTPDSVTTFGFDVCIADNDGDIYGRQRKVWKNNQSPENWFNMDNAGIMKCTWSSSITDSIALDSISVKTYGDGEIRLNATSNSYLPIAYTSSNTNVAIISGSNATIVGAGETILKAFLNGKESISATRTLLVYKAPLTVTAENKTRKVGEANPEFTLTYYGFVGTDDALFLDTKPTISCTANSASAAGQYDIFVNGGSDNNYEYNYVNGKLTIQLGDYVENKSINKLKFYPNPSINEINIKNVQSDKAQVLIYNLQGQVVLSKSITKDGKLNIESLSNGIYTIKLIDSNCVMINSVVKK